MNLMKQKQHRQGKVFKTLANHYLPVDYKYICKNLGVRSKTEEVLALE